MPQSPTPVTHARGAIRELGTITRSLDITSPFLVVDAGLRETDFFAAATAALRDMGFSPEMTSDFDPNPRLGTAEDIAKTVRGAFDGIIAIGGGSALDLGKCAAMLANNSAEARTTRGT